jgi:hypothetical protein
MLCAGLCATALAVLSGPATAQTPIPQALEQLRDPRISERQAEKVLVVEARGDPRSVGASAFGLLFQLYYRIPETPKGPQQPAPRARWPIDFDEPRTEWVGFYALPVPNGVTAVPEHQTPPGLRVALTVWEYGEVVEILHIGPYDREEPTMERLRAYAESTGYALVGEHEEEYIRGPTMTGPGIPDEYITVLRYRVRRR